jgi:hypothetical protein
VKLDANDGTGGWSIIVGGRVVPFRTTVLSAKLNRRPDGTFRLDEGILTSRVGVDDMLATAGALRIQTGEYVCAQPELYLPIKKLICASADLMRVPSADFTGVPCDALSLVLLFTAGPATIGRSAPPQAQTPVGCAIGLVDTCANAP